MTSSIIGKLMIIVLGMYLIGAFVFLDLNPMHWPTIGRIILSFIPFASVMTVMDRI
jgi:hypothetical protein